GYNLVPFVIVLFFFPSRRRHTISYGDWSSDVCSSDLDRPARGPRGGDDADDQRRLEALAQADHECGEHLTKVRSPLVDVKLQSRSEERRVGEEGRHADVDEYCITWRSRRSDRCSHMSV